MHCGVLRILDAVLQMRLDHGGVNVLSQLRTFFSTGAPCHRYHWFNGLGAVSFIPSGPKILSAEIDLYLGSFSRLGGRSLGSPSASSPSSTLAAPSFGSRSRSGG